MSTTLWVILATVLILLISYLAAVFRSNKTILTSKPISGGSATSGMLYYLPKGMLKITAKIKVKIEVGKQSKKVLNVKLLNQEFIHEKVIIPDIERCYELDYKSNVLADDTVEVKIDNDGFLESVNIVAEDKSVKILEEITKAPSVIFSAESGVESLRQMEEVEETIEEFSREFLLDPSTFPKKCKWLLNKWETEIGVLDASFSIAQIVRKKEVPGKAFPITSSDGVFTRPITVVEFKVEPLNEFINTEGTVNEFYEMLPSNNKILYIPVTRSNFIKKEHKLVFDKGVLKEYKVVKPSELEAGVSIPISVAKAIVSIPAQLLSVKINNTKKQAELAKEVQSLENLIVTGRYNEKIKRLEQEEKINASEKSKLETDKKIAELKKDLENISSFQRLETNKKLLELKKEIKQLEVQINKVAKK